MLVSGLLLWFDTVLLLLFRVESGIRRGGVLVCGARAPLKLRKGRLRIGG